MRKNVIILIFLILVSIGCLVYYILNQGNEKISTKNGEWKSLNYRVQNYRIDYPADWKAGKKQGNYCFQKADNTTSICIDRQNNDKGLNYNEFFGVSSLKNFDIKMIKVGKDKIEAMSYVSLGGKPSIDAKRNSDIETILIANGKKMLSINIVSQDWQKDKNKVQRMIDSFEITQ